MQILPLMCIFLSYWSTTTKGHSPFSSNLRVFEKLHIRLYCTTYCYNYICFVICIFCQVKIIKLLRQRYLILLLFIFFKNIFILLPLCSYVFENIFYSIIFSKILPLIPVVNRRIWKKRAIGLLSFFFVLVV